MVPAVSVIDKNVLARDPSNSSDGPFLKYPDNGKRVRDKRAGEEPMKKREREREAYGHNRAHLALVIKRRRHRYEFSLLHLHTSKGGMQPGAPFSSCLERAKKKQKSENEKEKKNNK